VSDTAGWYASPVTNALFYAPMTFTLLFGLAGAALLRVRADLHYAAYVGAAMLYMAVLDGTPFELRWPELPRLSYVASGAALAAASIAFARVFLALPATAPRLDRFLVGALAAGIAALAMTSLAPDALKPASLWVAATISALCVIAARAALRAGRRAVRFYAVGSAVIFVAALVAALAHSVTLPMGASESLLILKAGFVFHALMFATALADSARETRIQRDTAKQLEITAVAEQQLAADRLHATHKARIEMLLLDEQQRLALATTSREVREPLAELRRAMASMPPERGFGAETTAELGRSVDYLERLVHDCLGEVGVAAAAGDTFRVSTLLADVESLFRAAALDKGIELRCRGTRAEGRGDPLATLRILSNLVANAIKYTQSGGVLVGCRRRGAAAIRIVVADTGPGMSKAELALVLEPYRRGAAAARAAGTGLGLAIAARLAAELGYAFAARSALGRGTVFEIVVPLATSSSGELT
jgi:two-component system, sensor histidine kinase LadS